MILAKRVNFGVCSWHEYESGLASGHLRLTLTSTLAPSLAQLGRLGIVEGSFEENCGKIRPVKLFHWRDEQLEPLSQLVTEDLSGRSRPRRVLERDWVTY